MGGTSETTQSTQSKTEPWKPTVGLLKDIVGGVQGEFGNYKPTGAETGALNTMMSNAQSTGNYAPQATGLANDLMAGGGVDANSGILRDAYARFQNQLNPIASQNNDPTQAPGMQALLETIKNDVGNSVNGMFAGAGRDLSGMNVQTLARGLSQGMAAPLLNQYNQNVQNQMAAARGLYDAGGQTAQGMQGFNQQGFQNRALGLDTAINGIPQAQNAGAMGILDAASLQRNLPLRNLAGILGLTAPIAGLGSQSSGTSTGTQTDSGMRQFAQFGQGLGGMFGGANPAAGNMMQMGGALFTGSDRRMKDDITQIGELYDGTPVYRFRYKGDPRVSVGLMADDVEKFAPEAVAEFGGLKMVDYGAATERAAEMGTK